MAPPGSRSTASGVFLIVNGTPRWAVFTAYGAVLSVVPSAVWRMAVGFGAHLGTTQEWRRFQDVPGWGTVYVTALSVLSLGAASLTLGLVYRWGEVVPSWVRWIGDRRIPVLPVVLVAVIGAAAVIGICVISVINWGRIIGFAGRPAPGWDVLGEACYAPALAWGPLVLATTAAYWRRRHT